jgi:hypothetical protein
MSQPYRLGQPFAGRQVQLRQGTEIKIIGSEVLRSPPRPLQFLFEASLAE